jgi:hypothetical protein
VPEGFCEWRCEVAAKENGAVILQLVRATPVGIQVPIFWLQCKILASVRPAHEFLPSYPNTGSSFGT